MKAAEVRPAAGHCPPPAQPLAPVLQTAMPMPVLLEMMTRARTMTPPVLKPRTMVLRPLAMQGLAQVQIVPTRRACSRGFPVAMTWSEKTRQAKRLALLQRPGLAVPQSECRSSPREPFESSLPLRLLSGSLPAENCCR